MAKRRLKVSDPKRPILFVLGFAAVGLAALLVTSAAPNTAQLEAELGNWSVATAGSDNTASNFSFIKFGSATAPPVTPDCNNSLYHFVTPSGSAQGDGSCERPWDLQTALNHPSAVKAGDTIWLRNGTYGSGSATIFTGNLGATGGQPIVVRAAPGERATIDGRFNINGSNTWYWGLEVMNSDPNRVLAVGASRAGGIEVYGTNVKVINSVVHDAGAGINSWAAATASEIYGNVVYYTGWQASDRGHGHSFYTQSNESRFIVDNIALNSYSFGIHGYGSSAATLKNIYAEGNTIFNSGMMASNSGVKSNFMIGGGKVAESPSLIGNYGYMSDGDGRNGEPGYDNGCTNPTVKDNYFAGGTALTMGDCNLSGAVISGNTLIGSLVPSNLPQLFPNNTYNPAKTDKVFIRANKYEAGRANITIYNWSKRATVPVDLSTTGLVAGQQYEIRDAQNYYGTLVASGTYNGSPVSIPMTGLTTAVPVGNAPFRPPHTAPEFNAFVVMPKL